MTTSLKELHRLLVPRRIEYKVHRFLFKSLNHSAPAYTNDLHQRSHRHYAHSTGLASPKTHTTDYGDQVFSHNATVLPNKLPTNIRNIDSLNTFQTHIKKLFSDLFWERA